MSHVKGVVDEVVVVSGTDWAGDKVERKSSSVYMVFAGGVLLADQTKKISIRTISGGESEFYGGVSGTCVAILIANVPALVGVNGWKPIRLLLDSKAAVAMCRRQGAGGVRHPEVKSLWIQQKVELKTLIVQKVLWNVESYRPWDEGA